MDTASCLFRVPIRVCLSCLTKKRGRPSGRPRRLRNVSQIGFRGADMVDARLPERADFTYFMAIPTRWMDNDIYGHVNNVTYYSYFDTAVNHHLITAGGLDIHDGPAFGVVAETSCRFLKQLQFPDVVHAGIRVTRLGRSSVSYEIGLFRGDDDEPAALGTFVHVWVDRVERRPVPVPDEIRAALAPLVGQTP